MSMLCIMYLGAAGRARPRRGQQTDLIVKAPAAAEQQDDIDPEDDFVDPFDTTIVDKVIPVRKAIKSADLAVEDEDFNPTSTFNSTKEEIGKEKFRAKYLYNTAHAHSTLIAARAMFTSKDKINVF